jgi:hypothetical protein
MTRGSVGAYLNREVRSEAIGHVAAPDPIPAGGQSPELQGTWQVHTMLLVLS